jgi:hypothetical protein
MVVTNVPEHVRVHTRKPDPGGRGQAPQPSGGGAPFSQNFRRLKVD